MTILGIVTIIEIVTIIGMVTVQGVVMMTALAMVIVLGTRTFPEMVTMTILARRQKRFIGCESVSYFMTKWVFELLAQQETFLFKG